MVSVRAAAISALLFCLLLFSSAAAESAESKKPVLYFIYSERCGGCSYVEPAIQKIEQNYSERVSVEWIEATKQPGRALEVQQSFGVPFEKIGLVPKVLFLDYYCDQPLVCASEIEGKVLEYIAGLPAVSPSPSPSPASGEKISVFEMAVLAAVDSVNPCSLAVLAVLLTAILVRFPDKKGKALLAGLFFSAAVFFAYFLTGALIIFGFKSALAVTQLDTLWIYRLIALLAVALGLVEVRNFFRDPKTCPVLNLPEKWKPYWAKLVEGTLSAKGAVVIGLFVSLFLLPCSAGPYLVAGGILSGIPWSAALAWLLFYDSIFIVPMVSVTLLVYAGLSAVENVDEWQHRNMKYMHMIAGIVLVLLGIAMFSGLL